MARDQLIIAAIPMAKRIAGILARKHRGDVDDFTSVALLGLVKAERVFDAGRGTDFTTFAKAHARGEIIDFMRSQGVVPKHVLARWRAAPDGEAQAAQYHTRRVFRYDDIVGVLSRDAGLLEERLRRRDLYRMIDQLPPRYALVIRQRLAEVLTVKTGKQLGVTDTRIVQMWGEAEKKLREMMAAEGLTYADLAVADG